MLDIGENSATRDPSGDTDAGNCAAAEFVRRSAEPVPSAACQYRLGLPPPRVEAQMIRLPSADQTGAISTPGSTLIGVSVSRARSHTQMSLVPFRTST